MYKQVVFSPSKQHQVVPVPNRFLAVGEDREVEVRGLERRRHGTPPVKPNAARGHFKLVISVL
jgi:DNA polymerase elongation subunit (family B)